MAQKKPRISWMFEGVEKTFLEACLHEVTVNGREGSSLKPISWKNVVEKLKTEYNFTADQKQLKNHYDYLKSKFGAWLKLKNKTGNVYNPVTNTFNMEEEEWQLEIKSNKYVKSLRSSPLLYADICIQLFEGVASNGFENPRPISTRAPPSEDLDLSVRSLNDCDDIEKEPPNSRDPSGVSEESSGRSKKHGAKRKGKDTINEKIIEIVEGVSKIAKMLEEKRTVVDDMDACMEKLEKLEWGMFDARYNTALLLFGESADLRKVWLRIHPDICETWVRNAGGKYGLL